MHDLLLIMALLFLLPGFVGIIIPVVPGIPYMLLVAVVFGFADRFVHLTGAELGWLALLTLVSLVVDHLAGILGARFGGASKKAMGFGFLGALAGTFLLPPFGGLIGLFTGIVLAEMSQFGDRKRAVRAGAGGLLGAVAGIVLNLFLGVAFFIAFLTFALR